MSVILAMAVLVGGECVWWLDVPDAHEIMVECDTGAGWFACGSTPTSIDSGPFGVSRIRYMPLLKLGIDPSLGQTISVRIRAVNEYGQSSPSAPVEVVWPGIWDPALAPECGDGVASWPEVCDGSDLGGETCQSQGFDYGQLTCSEACDTIETGACQYSHCGNGICEIVAGEDCVTCSVDCNGVDNGPPGNRYCCGYGVGRNPIQCDDPRCSADGNSCVD